MKLLRAIFKVIDKISKAKDIKANEEKQPRSIRYGISSLIYSILAIPCSLGILLLIKSLETGNPVIIIFGAAAGLVIGVGGTLVALFHGFLDGVLQLYINKKLIGWIAIIVWIASIVVSAILLVNLLNMI